MSAKLILIVDDEVIWSAALATILRHHGFRTAIAGDGLDAAALARREPPDLIILDLAMPRMDGVGFLRTLRAAGPPLAGVPVVVVSAVTDPKAIAAAAGLQVHGHFLKGDHPMGELLDAIRRALPQDRP